ncbi:Protein FAM8A1 [Pseudolycoriella hygida]|uniref:Protein FAM8A1 n=1 Tax=Pseudolycoriella hygida TaxID=35572 RepID=A0A9Q0S9B4_9DIPT|nr:Protein FAM8A1 [Pseudolycoriella hygida]
MIIDIFEIDFGFDFDAIKSSIEDDYSEFIQFSSEMVYIEIITKIVVCFYEALWTRQGHGQILGGATPGKIVMGIRILYIEAIIPLDPENINLNNLNQAPFRVLVFPGANLGFRRALSRALAKNLLMAILFPFCFAMFFFRSNRTSYDIMTKTIVVEENAAPVLLRR